MPETNHPPTVALTTVGCKLNQYETEQIREQFLRAGCEIVPFDAPAAVYVVNSCTVTSRADRDSRRLARRARRRNPDAFVVVTGCYAEVSDDAVAAIPEIDLVVGNADKPRLAQLVADSHARFAHSGADFGRIDAQAAEGPLVAMFWSHTRAFLKVQDGCDASCTYCIVRRARGPSRSVPLDRALEQARRFIDAGHPEIVLVGVHLGAYGLDLSPPLRLADLAARMAELPGLGRLRLSSVEPHEVDDDLMALVAGSEKLCRHFHLPVQSGHDELLRRMDRPYTGRYVADLVSRLSERIPAVGIGADIIVGFPGEGDEQFRCTRELLAGLPLTYLHVFSYSPRPGTPAAEFPDQVQEEVKKRRCGALRALSAEKACSFARSLAGTTAQIVVEGRHPRGDGLLTGLTDNYVRVALGAGEARVGEMVRARIAGIRPDGLLDAVTEHTVPAAVGAE